jgi:hypothetical protein
MIERGGGEGFSLEPLASARILFKFFGQKFQCDMATPFQVFGFVDHAHAAATEGT